MAGITVSFVNTTTFTVATDLTADFNAGRRVRLTATSGYLYGNILSSSYSDPNTTVILTTASDNLDSSISVVYYGIASDSIGSLPTHSHDKENEGGTLPLLNLSDTPAAYDTGKYLKSTASGTEWGTVTEGTMVHSELSNLAYADSGHTGFQPAGDYATDSELTTLSGVLKNDINGKSDIGHLHDDIYYTETELDAGQLDNRYYTESEVDTISGTLQTDIDDKSDTSHLHDDRYYTESEIDTISGSLNTSKSDVDHSHTESDISDLDKYTQAEVDSLITTISGKLDDHNELNNLDYVSSGHTGFQPSGNYTTDSELTTLSGNLQTNIDTKLENVIDDIDPELGGDLSCNNYNIENVGRMCGNSLSSKIYNDTGSTLTKGTAVTICGLHDEVCTVCVSDNREIGKMPCCGVIESNIANGAEGCGIRIGRITMDTSGMTGSPKDRLYVQNDGSLDTVTPTSGMVQRAGFLVVKASGNAGRICVCVRGPRSMYSAKDQHPIVRMGDDVGHQKTVFKDYTDNEVAGFDDSGNLTLSGTVDGVDIATLKSDYDSHEHDDRYYTESEVDTISGTLQTDIDTRAASGDNTDITSMEMSSANPYLTLHNTAHEDTDYGRESELIFKGEQSGGEETTLGKIQVAHDGTTDDQKGIMSFKVNDGNDADAPGTAMTILANGNVGIGITGPSEKLEIAGNLRFDTSRSILTKGVGTWLQIGNNDDGMFNIGGDGGDSIMYAHFNNLVYQWYRGSPSTISQSIEFTGKIGDVEQEYFKCTGHPDATNPNYQKAYTQFATESYFNDNVGIGTTTPGGKLCVNGGITVGSDTDAGDNNLRVEGDITIIGNMAAQLKTGENDIKLDSSLSADGKYSGLTRDGVLGATIAYGKLVYLNTTDQRWELADADAETTSGDVELAITLASGIDGETRLLLVDGFVREDDWNFTSFGQAVFVSCTAGDMTQTVVSGTGDIVRVVGYAGTTADEIHFKPSGTWIELA